MAEKSSVEILKAENPNSQQVKDSRKGVGTRSPKIAFKTLTDMYYDSFVVGGLTDKTSTATNSGFVTKDA